MVARGKNKEISKDNLIIDWSDVNILEFPNKSWYGEARSSKSVGRYGEARSSKSVGQYGKVGSLKSAPEVPQPQSEWSRLQLRKGRPSDHFSQSKNKPNWSSFSFSHSSRSSSCPCHIHSQSSLSYSSHFSFSYTFYEDMDKELRNALRVLYFYFTCLNCL
jgi:hypothetical protein